MQKNIDIMNSEHIELTDELLEYVDNIVNIQDCFEFEEDEDGVFTVLPSLHFSNTFKYRYNNSALKHNFIYSNYLKNSDIQNTLLGLGLNPQKFWFLLLYIFDYTYNICIDGVSLSKTPKEEITEFINMILANSTGNEKDLSFNKTIELELKIGKAKLVIKNPDTINYLYNICSIGIDNINDSFRYRTVKSEKHNESNSVWIWLFSKMLLSFLDTVPDKRRPKGSSVSFSKLLLISRLVYFTGLSTNEYFESSDDAITSFLKQYKNYKMNIINNFYNN